MVPQRALEEVQPGAPLAGLRQPLPGEHLRRAVRDRGGGAASASSAALAPASFASPPAPSVAVAEAKHRKAASSRPAVRPSSRSARRRPGGVDDRLQLRLVDQRGVEVALGDRDGDVAELRDQRGRGAESSRRSIAGVGREPPRDAGAGRLRRRR